MHPFPLKNYFTPRERDYLLLRLNFLLSAKSNVINNEIKNCYVRITSERRFFFSKIENCNKDTCVGLNMFHCVI